MRNLVKLLWILFIFSFGSLTGFVFLVQNNAFGWFGGMPSLDDLEKPETELSSELISGDGVLLGKYFRSNRTPIKYHELSTELVNTLLVTEDIRFQEHSGIDLRGLLRATAALGQDGGASTITMQLAENLYETNDENKGSIYRFRSVAKLVTKIKEWIIAVRLEKSYTKEEILAMYLNTIEFGSNSFGIQVAANTYFKKSPSELNYQESAVLVGALNATTRYNPVLNPDLSLRKRTEILDNIRKYQLITQAQFDSLNALPLGLKYQVLNQNVGPAPYFRTVAGNFLRSWCKTNGYDLYADGLKIYTTINSKMQVYAEKAVEEHMKYLQGRFDKLTGKRKPWIDSDRKEIKNFLPIAMKRTDAYRYLRKKFGDQSDSIEYYLNKPKKMTVFSWEGEIDTTFSSYDSLAYFKKFLHTGFMAMEPKTGHIKAWVGGINHKYFKYDHVRQGKRQPGSTFKPFVYTSVIQNGWNVCQTQPDVVNTYDLPDQDPPFWRPTNSSAPETGDILTMRQAMARSVNTITAYAIMNWTNPTEVVKLAHRMGISSELAEVPSIALGVSDVSVFEMVGAYGTFVNGGVHTVPFFIAKIEDKNGNIIQEFYPDRREAINEVDASIMLHMLKGTTEERGGTALGLSRTLRLRHDIGAKTGTTDNASDGWFMGITNDLAAGAWVGGDDRSIHFRYWIDGQGARTAMPIWEKFMLKVYSDSTLGYKGGPFKKPDVPIDMVLDCSLYDNLGANKSVDDIVNPNEIMNF